MFPAPDDPLGQNGHPIQKNALTWSTFRPKERQHIYHGEQWRHVPNNICGIVIRYAWIYNYF